MSARRMPRLAPLLLLALGASCADAPSMTLRHVALDLLAGEPFWEVVQAPPDHAPHVDTLTPTVDPAVDGADRLSLVLPPDSEVRFRIPELAGPLFLETAAGVDLSLARRLARAGRPPLALEFELWLDDQLAFRESITTHPKLAVELETKAHLVHRWHPVGEGGRLAVRAGQTVRLRASFAPDAHLTSGAKGAPERIRAGFADLALVRFEERPRERASAERPNVVLIVMDTLRADRTSLYGARPTTPHLARLAERGLVFESAYASSSWTWPSVSSLLTGLEPGEHGVVSNASCLLAQELRTLAEALQEAGWTTATFSGNPLISPWRDFDQGVETFDHAREIRKSRDVVPRGLEWMERQGDRRFFVHFQLMDPHSPHLPRTEDLERFCGVQRSERDPSLLNALNKVLRGSSEHTGEGQPGAARGVRPEDKQWLSSVYDASVATGDYWLGQIVDQIERLGLGPRTLIVFTSDHGEELFDHGLLEHAHTLFEELVRVPLVLAGPGIEAGRVRGLVTNRLLGPTIAARVGADLPGEVLPLAPGESAVTTLFFDTRKGWWNGREFVPVFGIREGDWVLHDSPAGRPWGAGEDEGTGPDEGEMRLYDLARDPRQERDLAKAQPERASALREKLREHQRDLARRAPRRGDSAASGALLETLRSMGYAGAEGER